MRAAGWLILLAPCVVAAHDPVTTNLTWSKEISRIVYKRCAGCHNEGGTAVSLMNYGDVRPLAKSIRDEVANRRMPPWDAVKGVGEFRGDLSLSQVEIEMVVSWVEGGAPEGEPEFLPMKPGQREESVTEGAGRGTRVLDRLTMDGPRRLVALRPEGAAEVRAVLPDGSIKRVLWVRNFRQEWNRTYELRDPTALPKGSRLLVSGAAVRVFLK